MVARYKVNCIMIRIRVSAQSALNQLGTPQAWQEGYLGMLRLHTSYITLSCSVRSDRALCEYGGFRVTMIDV